MAPYRSYAQANVFQRALRGEEGSPDEGEEWAFTTTPKTGDLEYER